MVRRHVTHAASSNHNYLAVATLPMILYYFTHALHKFQREMYNHKVHHINFNCKL